MKTKQIWIRAARPKTLFASISLTLLGVTLACAEGSFDLLRFCLTLFTALGIQITTNFANDYFDFLKGADTEERKGPLRVTQAGLVSLANMRKGILISLSLTTLLGCFLIYHGGFLIATFLSLSLLLSILYTGGPYPLAYLGLGDLFAFSFFGPIAVFGAYFIQTHAFSWDPILAGIGAGALSTALLSINNVRDEEEDRGAHKKTLVVRFGRRFGQIEYTVCLFISALIPFLFLSTHPFCLLSLVFCFPALTTLRTLFSFSDPRQLNEVLGKTGQMMFLYSLFFCIGWLL